MNTHTDKSTPERKCELTPDEKVRVIVDLPLGTIEILRELAVSQNLSLTETLRRAIVTESLVQRRVEKQSFWPNEKNYIPFTDYYDD